MRRIELRRHELLGAEAGDAHHPHIAVAPGLSRNPFDQIVAVERARTTPFRFGDAAGISDDVHVATPDEKARVAGFRRTGPQHRPCRMGQRRLGEVGALQVLVVDREGQEGRELVGRVRAIDVDRDLDAVAHRHKHVLLDDHAGIGRRTIIVDRCALAGQRKVKSLRLRHASSRSARIVADLQALAAFRQDAIRSAQWPWLRRSSHARERWTLCPD
jgi:hypothetical protein